MRERKRELVEMKRNCEKADEVSGERTRLIHVAAHLGSILSTGVEVAGLREPYCRLTVGRDLTSKHDGLASVAAIGSV